MSRLRQSTRYQRRRIHAARYLRSLKDAVTHFDGPGSYHIQLVTGSGIGGTPSYVVTYGIKPLRYRDGHDGLPYSSDPTGDLVFTDARNLNVTVATVNQSIAQIPYSDGSPLTTGIVTTRAIAGGVIGGRVDCSIRSVQPEGDILYRGATSWLVLAPGTSGNVLQTNGAGAAQAVPGGGVTSLNSLTGALSPPRAICSRPNIAKRQQRWPRDCAAHQDLQCCRIGLSETMRPGFGDCQLLDDLTFPKRLR